jgi:hypothetical protein
MKPYLIFLSACMLTFQIHAQTHRYLNITSFGILAGTSADRNPAPLSIISEHHYRFNKAFSAGLFTGIEQLHENIMPVALNIKFYLPAGKSAFFISGVGGFSVSLEKPHDYGLKKARGGNMAGIETGTLIRINENFSAFMAIGYRYNTLKYDLEDWWIGSFKRNYTFNRVVLRLGIAID